MASPINPTFTFGSPQWFPETDVNDTLRTYLKIIEQNDKSLEPTESRLETANRHGGGSKWGGSPEPVVSTSKWQRINDTEFPWSIRENLSRPELCEELQKTLNLFRIYTKDIKLTKSSLLTTANAPQFPNSEWLNIIIGAMVNLDHIISGSFEVSSDNWDTKVIWTIQFKFGAEKAIKQVRTSGDWFIAWGMYTKVAVFTFPHRKLELEIYGSQILSLFAATSINKHAHVITLDKAIWVWVREHCDLCSQTMLSLKTSGCTGSTQSVQAV